MTTNNIKDAIYQVADFMALAARTAPKAKGVDNIAIKILKKDELEKLASLMVEVGADTERLKTFKRDSNNILQSSCVVIIGTKTVPLGLNCSFCGFENCKDLQDAGAVCAYNSGDLGIAVGSACETASKFHVDNRIMYTVGYTIVKRNLMGDEIKIAFGIPLSGTGKNPFFDRK